MPRNPHPAQPALLSGWARRLAPLCVALLGLAACTPLSQNGAGPASVDRADRLQRQGNFTAAAQMYERLAMDNPAPDSGAFSLAAARAWLSANRADDAQRVLDGIGGTLNAQQQFERDLLRAETGTARGQYAAAWQQISKVAEPANASDDSRLLRLKQDIALKAGQPLEAVRAGIARERVASSDAERTTARRDLLGDLRTAIDRGLRIDPAAAGEPLVRGWLEIGQIAAAAGRSPMGAEAALERWRSRYPGHPAATIAFNEIVAPAARTPTSTASIAGPIGLLLPLTGQYAARAELVRDGFLASMARVPQASRPVVRVYDTGASSVASAMQAAQSEGAGLLVGPLGTPEEVQAAAEQRPGALPMLLLNNLNGSGFPGAQLYQYALAPADEARQIARQMVALNQRRAVVFAPAGEWGNRVAAAFAEELTRGGGVVVAESYYDLSQNNLTAALTAALAIDAGRDRLRRVQQITGMQLAFEPRPRADIDAIFVAGYQALALRQINPQLRFFNAGDIPTYITQDGLDADARGNRDLEGMRFVDMPWALEATGPVADTRAATEGSWSAGGSRQSRFFAFGYDAATIALSLRGTPTSWPVAGMTGRLSLTPEGRVERSLDWARVHNGQPELFDPLP